jgi:hypothetical protein
MSMVKALSVRDDAVKAWDYFAKRKPSMSGFVADLLVREYRHIVIASETDDERRRRLLDEIEQRLTELRTLCV